MARFAVRAGLLLAAAVLVSGGCGQAKREVAHLSGMVMFKGQPVPVGFINFVPDVTGGNRGEVKAFEIKDGVYNTAEGPNPGVYPGPNKIMISGFTGKPKLPLWPKGEQIFNPINLDLTVAPGANTKDFAVPASAGQNVRIVPTADPF
jgi:hypothetical protein